MSTEVKEGVRVKVGQIYHDDGFRYWKVVRVGERKVWLEQSSAHTIPHRPATISKFRSKYCWNGWKLIKDVP
jgi:hypothetical protein